ncbi:MAG: NAD(P)-dependent oxidoreductase [Akkermansiaceae bacterium]|nr:NAD(P)-dependent oxidoreductase [Akkermansiaceae bacterium]NNM28961.1 NAD(P)-dependent oxidoreductase [Akkermansiaceae bacterium]
MGTDGQPGGTCAPERAGKVALVTGASGFIGSRLCLRLVADGVAVHGVSRGNPLPASLAGVHGHRLDLSAAGSVRELIREVRPDYIFHLAGHVKGARGIEHVQPALGDNLVSTVNLLTACTEAGCERLFLAGSLEEAGLGNAGAAPVPTSPYAASKFAASCYARMFHELYGTPVVVGRIFMTYGPGQRDLTKLIPYSILSLLDGKPPKLMSGSRPMDWIFVDDLVEGMLALIRAPGIDGGTIDLGTGEFHTSREAVELLVELLGSPVVPEFGAVGDRSNEVVHSADTESTARAIGWRAQVPFREGLRRTIDWYREHAGSGVQVHGSAP